MKKSLFVPHDTLASHMTALLSKTGVRADVLASVVEGLIQTSLRGVDSHGVRLLPHYLHCVKEGRINPDPRYSFKRTSASTGILDADHTFGHAAGMEAVKHALTLARESGSGSVAIANSTHFGAAAYYSLGIAQQEMIGFCFTHADSLMRTHAGKTAFLGTNPISFAAPCDGEGPFCLDMATTVTNFNRIKILRQDGKKAPEGVGADAGGTETDDPHRIAMLLPIGTYKGFGLSLMVEILCSMLTGMPYGAHLVKMFDAPLSQKRFLGHFISALRIDCFQPVEIFKKRMAVLLQELRSQPPADPMRPVQVAGDPEKISEKRRRAEGIPLNAAEYEAFKKTGEQLGIPCPF